MKVINKNYDKKINGWNILLEFPLKEYYEISQKILKKNDLQRRRVKSSSTVYSLLKKDLLEGCIIPSIVLALTKTVDDSIISESNDDKIIEYINVNKEYLIILDGLQRTYTIGDLIDEIKNDSLTLDKLYKNNLRIEIYIGINKLGILYRMLTLNSGQTPMSIRHQIEILYSDYLNVDYDGIKLIKEAEDKRPQNNNEYSFRDIIEGFNSYLERDYLTIDRTDILDNIQSLEKLSKENRDLDLFRSFLKVYHNFAQLLIYNGRNWEYDYNLSIGENRLNLGSAPFVNKIELFFNKSQVMTGFGSAVGKLIDNGAIQSMDSLLNIYPKINFNNLNAAFDDLIVSLDKIRAMAKKIG